MRRRRLLFPRIAYPSTHWQQIRTNDQLERIIRELRWRTRVVGGFPDSKSALMLVAARLRPIASTQWGKRRYLVMDPLLNPAKQTSNASIATFGETQSPTSSSVVVVAVADVRVIFEKLGVPGTDGLLVSGVQRQLAKSF